MEKHHETLGENVVPNRYRLRLEPDLKTFKYKGDVVIEAKVRKKTRRIVINSAELEINKATIKSKKSEQNARVNLDKKRERLTLRLGEAIKGSIRIRIEFTGHNNDKMYGFYRSRYTKDKKEEYMLTTQFEAADARKAFPCFDEPSFKAQFDLSLLVDKHLSCISNMPIKEEKSIGNKKLVTFRTTTRMSPYLLYIGVGDFERTTQRFEGIEIGIVTTPRKRQYTKLSLDHCSKFLSFFQKCFGIKYPLPKLDLIAVPDFPVGAMENWGAITFREIHLLGDEHTSVIVKQRMAEVIAHELVHQWFGDLVTMKWWNDIWLNESFATFMSYKAMDAVFPKWNVKAQYLDDTVKAALSADQLASARPIRRSVSTPGEMEQMFDPGITYAKGGAILNMIEDYVGEKTFRKGIHLYLSKYAYSNATNDDLWDSISIAAKKGGKRTNISSLARCWIDHAGYPAITVNRGRNGLTLTQERFLLLDKRARSEIWLIPVRYMQSSHKVSQFMMQKKRHELKGIRGTRIKLNYNQTGFYRVIYPPEMLYSLGELIKEAEVGWADAWGLENDVYALTEKRRYGLDDYLNFVRGYCFAAKYPLNLSVISHLRMLLSLFYAHPEPRESIERLLREYSAEVIRQVGWIRSEDENNTITMLRAAAIYACGISGDTATIRKANKLFYGFINDKQKIDPNLKGPIYNLVAWSGGAEVYNTLERLYRREEVPEEKRRFLVALAMFKNQKFIRRALGFSLSKDVRYQDGFVIPAVASSNPLGREMVWKWTKKNWRTLINRYERVPHMLGRYVDNVSSLYGAKALKDVKHFFGRKSNMREGITDSVEKILERIEINTRLVDHNTG